MFWPLWAGGFLAVDSLISPVHLAIFSSMIARGTL